VASNPGGERACPPIKIYLGESIFSPPESFSWTAKKCTKNVPQIAILRSIIKKNFWGGGCASIAPKIYLDWRRWFTVRRWKVFYIKRLSFCWCFTVHILYVAWSTALTRAVVIDSWASLITITTIRDNELEVIALSSCFVVIARRHGSFSWLYGVLACDGFDVSCGTVCSRCINDTRTPPALLEILLNKSKQNTRIYPTDAIALGNTEIGQRSARADNFRHFASTLAVGTY